MKASPDYPQCHEDRKAQKLLDRIDKKLQAKNIPQNIINPLSPKQHLSGA